MQLQAVLVALALGADAFMAPAAPKAVQTQMNAKAAIIQNKGGGHGEIGYHLAKALKAKDMDVTILQDSTDKDALDSDCLFKPPFSRYQADLVDELGVNVVFADLSKYGPQYPRDNFNAAVNAVEWEEDLHGKVLRSRTAQNFTIYPAITHVFDNRAKDVQDLILPTMFAWRTEDLYKKDMIEKDFKLYTYVSSAGMYEGKGKLTEAMAVDGANKCKAVEDALSSIFPKKGKGHAKWCAFRPQYIYGPYTNKREYLDWFLARAAAGRPLVVPGNGTSPVCLTHAEDIADQLAAVVGQEHIAGNNFFNAGTDECVTYEQLCEAAADGLEKPCDVEYAVPGAKSSFPFRPTSEGFAVEVEKLKWALGWLGPKHSVLDDLKGWYSDDFLDLKLDEKPLDTSNDLAPAPEDYEFEVVHPNEKPEAVVPAGFVFAGEFDGPKPKENA